MRYRLMLVIVLLLVSLVEHQTPVSGAQGTTYTDPFAYCAAVRTIDAPDARYVGPAVPDAVVRGLQAALQRPPTLRPVVSEQVATGAAWMARSTPAPSAPTCPVRRRRTPARLRRRI